MTMIYIVETHLFVSLNVESQPLLMQKINFGFESVHLSRLLFRPFPIC